MKLLLQLSAVLCAIQCSAQRIELLTSNEHSSVRGLSVVNDKIIWASGSNGMVGRSVDSGKTWQWLIVKNYEKRDFRDIEAFNANEAIIMAVAEPALILKTKDAGRNWSVVFEDNTKGMFLDAMDFDGKHGVVIGDPVDHKIFMAYTDDKGDSWKVSSILNKIKPAEGEAFFASSGTNICLMKTTPVPIPVFVSGGTRSSLYISSISVHPLSLLQGAESTGANSIALADDHSGIIVGGDFRNDTIAGGNCVLFNLLPSYSERKPAVSPHGYRSCIAYIAKNKWVACGTSGVDISTDGGMNWKLVSSESFHVCQKARKGKSIFLAGAKGRIARLVW